MLLPLGARAGVRIGWQPRELTRRRLTQIDEDVLALLVPREYVKRSALAHVFTLC